MSRSTWCYTSDVATEISQREFRNDSGEIMRRLDAGESFVVTRNGVPVAELTPVRRRDRFVRAEVVVEAFRGAPLIDFRQLRADLDAHVDQDPTPHG